MATLDGFCNEIQWPKGPYPREVRAVCCEIKKGLSSKKKTPFVELFWSTPDGAFFSDSIYITGKAISRIAIVAQRVCGVPKDFQLPDNKDEAAIVLAKIVMEKAVNCTAAVTVEEYEEEYMVTEGPDTGKLKKVTKHQVAPFSGYKKLSAAPVAESQTEAPASTPPPIIDDGTLPF